MLAGAAGLAALWVMTREASSSAPVPAVVTLPPNIAHRIIAHATREDSWTDAELAQFLAAFRVAPGTSDQSVQRTGDPKVLEARWTVNAHPVPQVIPRSVEFHNLGSFAIARVTPLD